MLKIFFVACTTLALILLIVNACGPSKKHPDEEKKPIAESFRTYDLANPAQKIKLAKSLKEISGLSYYKDNQLICVNDEEGKIFIYDLGKEDIIKKTDFGKSGDYEGVEFVGNEVFAMKSNGKIKAFNINGNGEREIDCRNDDVVEYEGLGYDSPSNCLLLATKEHIKAKDEVKVIYSYDLTNKQLAIRFTITKEMITLPDDRTGFRPSGIAVHPLSSDIYIIASQGKKLLILTNKGIKKDLIVLNEKLFIQPEGICFTPSGDLYISSEGEDKKGYILKFISN
ncbi:SdiA-regulated domain-containing protein [Emticicia sp. BO119]|uniref:SdiA-regulated domain-containing protein n=1 Tax=Emticicia sp. BO119 TaxID=2757768 RepID=UPI0015F0A8C7|nr:SdiA-regulated domain-containing protein [Emticicia sp. BO119]MBA4853993.1 SdiA-regulated domain-containing protein [Emticicia sp. BO119]